MCWLQYYPAHRGHFEANCFNCTIALLLIEKGSFAAAAAGSAAAAATSSAMLSTFAVLLKKMRSAPCRT